MAVQGLTCLYMVVKCTIYCILVQPFTVKYNLILQETKRGGWRWSSIKWSESYKISRLHGFSPTTKSFLFQLIHTFLPCKARVSRIIQANSSLCCCKGWEETFITFSSNASRTRRLDKLFLDALGRLPLI